MKKKHGVEKKSAMRSAWKGIARAVAAIALSWLLFGCDSAYGNFRYRVINNGTAVELTHYSTRWENVGFMQIPSHIGGLPVARIGEFTFTSISGGTRRSLGITEVSIPNTVTYIGRSAFISNRLTSIDMHGTLVYVASFNANNLTSVDIPEGVRYIGDWAFRMNQLMSVNIPDSVVDIGREAFRHNRLIEVSVPRHTTITANAFDSGVAIIRRD